MNSGYALIINGPLITISQAYQAVEPKPYLMSVSLEFG